MKIHDLKPSPGAKTARKRVGRGAGSGMAAKLAPHAEASGIGSRRLPTMARRNALGKMVVRIAPAA